MKNSPAKSHVTILGAGAAGLAAGYYARKANLPLTIYEADKLIGGNAVTIEHNNFLFDSGAHRFHNKDQKVTSELLQLMGDEMMQINVPSQIYDCGSFIDFPLSPLNLIKGLGLSTFCRAGFEVVWAKMKKNTSFDNFESFALNSYGATIANRVLLNYSEKLWGKPTSELSPAIAGRRLEGLTLKSFIVEALLGGQAKTKHLDGTFFYPVKGIGMIVEKLQQACNDSNLITNAKITKLYHDQQRISAIEINHTEKKAVEKLICTFPLSHFLTMLDPAPPDDVLSAVKELKFRHVILAVFFLDQDSVSKNASIYFPAHEFPFTRIYEPKKRSSAMAPTGKTSLVAEIPCQSEDSYWQMDDQKILAMAQAKLCETGLITAKNISDALVYRMPYAYPVLEKGFEKKMAIISTYLKRFSNLEFSGRNGLFSYIHIHDLMHIGEKIINTFNQSKDQ